MSAKRCAYQRDLRLDTPERLLICDSLRQKPAPKKKAGKGAAAQREVFVWVDQIPDVLGVMVKALRTLRTERIWQTTAERDGLIS